MSYLQKFRTSLQKLSFPDWSIPVALFAVCAVSFGVLIPTLGFYWDDWETILIIRQFPLSEFWAYFSDNRPLAAWTYILASPFLGSHVFAWHSFTLILRFLTVLAFWWVFTTLWRSHKREVTYAALLFTVYPIFMQQPISVAYHQHWLAFLLFFCSLGFMLQAVQKPQRYWLFTSLSLLTLGLHLSILEYFVGVEFIRPLLLWFFFAASQKENKKRLSTVIRHWLPYLGTLAAFIGWRFWYTLGNIQDNNRPSLLFEFLKTPIQATLKLLEMFLQDTVFVLVSSWYKTLAPELIDLTQNFSLFSWGIAVLLGALLAYYLLKLRITADGDLGNDHWQFQAVLIGFAIIILGTLPAWITNRQASTAGLNIDRFAMVAMAGASLVFAALLEWLSHEKLPKVILLASLIVLGSALHIRNANDFRWSWIRQQRLLWQLYWRAPAVEANTTFLSENQLVPYVAPTFAFNLLYSQPQDATRQLPYQFYQLTREFAVDSGSWLEGKALTEEHREFTFTGFSKHSLMLYYKTPHANCLWLLSLDDQTNPYISSSTRQALALSDFGRIINQSQAVPPVEILGNSPDPDWCYYFEKADLARQNHQWQTVIELGNQAREAGYSPKKGASNSPQEWLPFIEGYALSGDWSTAQSLTTEAYQVDPKYRQRLCLLWDNIATLTNAGEQIILNTQNTLGCADLPPQS